MELGLSQIQALSSPARVRILKELLQQPTTPADLGATLDMQREQVIMHVETLKNAGLVEEYADREMQFRYRATDKATAIVEGKEQKMQFSLAASVLSAVFGVLLLGSSIVPSVLNGSQQAAMEAASGTTGTETVSSASTVPWLAVGLGVAGILLLGVALLTHRYRTVLKRL